MAFLVEVRRFDASRAGRLVDRHRGAGGVATVAIIPIARGAAQIEGRVVPVTGDLSIRRHVQLNPLGQIFRSTPRLAERR